VDTATQTRIILRPIGSPMTLGMAGLTIASFVQSGLDLKWIADTQGRDVGLILLAVPFVLQLLACTFFYLARDGAAGSSIGVLATTWLAIGLVHVSSPAHRTSGAMGLLLLASAAVLTLSALAVSAAKPLLAIVFLLSALRFGLAGVYELSEVAPWQNLAGVVGLVLSAVAGYCVLAFELEGQERRSILPTLRRGRGERAISNNLADQVDGIANEAGVRQTS
jgi:succinate-acetate transporter protein